MADFSLLDSFKKIQAEGIVVYASPTTDHTYKKVFLNTIQQDENKIGRDFCNAMLRIMTKGDLLTVRKVEVMSEHVDGVFRNFYLSVRTFIDVPDQQNLKVDALFCADMIDNRRAEGPTTRSKNIPKKPAYILGEMQVGRQNFGTRLLSYGAKILSGCSVNLRNNVIPPPVYATGFCMWNCGSLVKGPLGINSRDLDVDSTEKRFTEIFCTNIFLGEYVNILKTDKRADVDQRLAEHQATLKKKVVDFFKKGDFASLLLEEKKVYLWLEFLAFAHLMSEARKTDSLGCLGDDQVEAKAIFNEAYNVVKFNFEGGDMEQIRNNYNYLDLYGLGQEQAILTSIKFVMAAIKKDKAGFIADPASLVEIVDKDIRDDVYQRLGERGVEADAREAFQAGIAKLQEG